MREAQIVADASCRAGPTAVAGDDGAVARPDRRCFRDSFRRRQIDVEHVDLVVAGDDGAVGIDQERAVGEPPLALGAPGSPAMSMTSEPSQAARRRSRAPARERPRAPDRRLAARLLAPAPAGFDEVADLGRHDEIGAAVARSADQLARPRGYWARARDPAVNWMQAAVKAPLICASPSLGSSLPARSSATRSSQPPI